MDLRTVAGKANQRMGLGNPPTQRFMRPLLTAAVDKSPDSVPVNGGVADVERHAGLYECIWP